MDKLKIDENYLRMLSSEIESFIKVLDENRKAMIDESEDLFARYVSFSRLFNTKDLFIRIAAVVEVTFSMGHDLHDKVFHTEAYSGLEWDTRRAIGNPFFVNEEAQGQKKECIELRVETLVQALEALAKAKNHD